MKSLSLLVPLAVSALAAARQMTVYNGCPFTVWPAFFTSPGSPSINYPSGWAAGEYTAVSFTIPNNWNGRIWARRDCDFSNSNPATQCADGGCNGGLECSQSDGTGVPPASLAEFNLDANGVDYYDVSLVDGYNLPIRIDNSAGCGVADCPVDLGPDCPSALKGPYDSTGYPVGCKSACVANLSGNPSNSPNCCTGQYDSPQSCPSSGVQYYSYFKDNCPNAYAYAYDDATSLFACSASSSPSYQVTFCPPANW